MIMRTLDRYYGIDKPQDPPDDIMLAAMGESWDRHLSNARPRPMPTNRLNEVYERAVRDYEDKGPFSIFDMTRAWRNICAEESRPAMNRVCTWTDGHVDDELNVEGVIVGTGAAVKLPCPSCRPAAYAQRRIELAKQFAQQKTASAKSPAKKATKKSARKK